MDRYPDMELTAISLRIQEVLERLPAADAFLFAALLLYADTR